ncbi:MAG: hypothetical protein SF052_01905 [Bacteroidia bacterium]|nr:hypothetical protein [Bacteroidia bacterium]
MAKFLLICRKDKSAPLITAENADFISSQILPDNISPHSPEIKREDEGLEYVIFNPVSVITREPGVVCMGAGFSTDKADWHPPLAPKPLGTFALFRFNASQVELVSDMVASQTIWYYHDDKVFLASTCQRAILFFLEGFEFNPAVLPWMLSTGTLGPGFSWDKRLKSVSADGTVLLDRKTWKISRTEVNVALHIKKETEAYHRTETEKVLEETLENMDFPEDKWVLSLSGGYDSRGLLLYLKNRRKIRCVTWGLETLLDHKLSDAYVAKSLTEHFSLPFRFFSLDNTPISFHDLFHRFLIASEGRTDHIAGYSDGLELWRQLYDSGIEGMLRADQVYETKNIRTIEETIKVNGIISLDQFSNTRIFKKYGLGKLTWPEGLWINKGESLVDWSARLYHNFRLPYVQAPLNAIKTCYLEMSSPLLSRPIVNNAYSLPDEFRFKKRLFKEIVQSKTPDIPFATYNASHKIVDLLMTKEAVNELKQILESGLGKDLLPDEILNFLLGKLRTASSDLKQKSEQKKKRESIKQNFLVGILRKFFKKNQKSEINLNLLAFRVAIILKITEILKADSLEKHTVAQAK